MVLVYAKPAFDFPVAACCDLASTIHCRGSGSSLIVVQGLYAPVNIIFVFDQKLIEGPLNNHHAVIIIGTGCFAVPCVPSHTA